MEDKILISREVIENLNERVKKLAIEKSYLQVFMHLMSEMNSVSGLENVIQKLLQVILENIGGSNLIVYYKIEHEIYYADVLGKITKIEEIADELVKKVFDTKEHVEVQSDFANTKLLADEFTKASTWVFPLLAGSDLIAVLKIENLYTSTSDLHFNLPTFFSYVAHIIKNEILGYTKLKATNDQLLEENSRRRQAEEELKSINNELESRVIERTKELHHVNSQLEEELAERERAEMQLETQYTLLTALVNSTDDIIIFSLDKNYCYTAFNKKHRNEMKKVWNTDIKVGMNLLECMQIPELRELAKQSIDKALKGEVFSEIQHQPDHDIYYEFNWNPIVQKNKVVGATSFIRDITQTKRYEAQILKLNRIYAVLSNINQAIVRIHNKEQLMDEACRIAVNYGKFPMVWFGMVNSKTNKVDVIASNGVSTDYLNEIDIDLNDKVRSNGPSGRAIKTGKHQISNNILSDNSMIPWRDNAARYGFKSSASFPLIVFGKVEGAFNIYSGNIDFFSQEDVNLLDEMATDISFAFEYIELETRRKTAESELQRTNELLRAIIEAAPIAIFDLDLEGKVNALWNPASEKLLGWKASEVIGKYLPTVPTENREEFEHFREQIRNGLTLNGVDVMRQKRDGTPIAYSIYASPLSNPEGQIKGNVAVLLDITERKRNEAINASRLKLMQIAATRSMDELLEETLNEAEKLTGSLIGFYHFIEDDQVSLTLQNWSTKTKAEFCKAEGKGMHYPISQAGVWIDCVTQRKPVIHNDYASLPNRKGMPEGHAEVIRELVVPVLRGDTIKAILGVGNKPTDYDQKDIEAVSLLADLAWEIAERKLAEDLLRAERGLFVCGPTVIFKWRAREGWPVEYVSPNVLDQFGYTPQDFTSGKVPYATIIHPDDLERVATEVNTYSKQGVTSFEQVYRIIHRNGTYRWIDDFTSVITDRDGNIANFLGYILDITERKLAEKALQESEQKYRTLIQKIQAAVIVHSADTQIITCNTKAQQLLGISEDQLLGKTVIDPAWHFFHEDNSIMGLEDYPANKVFATKKELRNYIVGVHRPNNTNDVWVLVNADPVFDTSDQLSQVIVTFIDITERKLAEKNLLKASEDIHDLYNHAPCGYHSLNKDGLVVQMNDTELEWMGYTRGEVIGKLKFTELFTEKSLKNFEHNFPKFKTTGLIQNLEFDLIRKNGSIFTILLSATAIYDQEGNFQMSRSTVTDITELKKSEKALEESNRHYHQIVDLSQDMIVIHQHGKVVFINDAGVKLVGASKPEDIIGRSVLDFVPQNLKEVAKKRIVSGLTGGELKSPIYEQKLLRLDGIVIDIDLRGMNIQYHGDGAIQFVARDITDRKQAEAKLIESEQKFRSLAEGSPDNIIRYDTGCRAVYINRNMYLTISPEVAANIGKTPTEGSQYPGIIDYETKLRKVIQTGRPDEMEFDVPNPNGELRTHHIRFVAEQNNDGAIIGAIAIGRDITDRKQSELALQEREKHSRSLLRLSRKFEIAQDYDEILLAAFEEVQKIIGYKNLWAYQITEDKKYAISLAAHGSVSGIIMSDTGTGRLTIQGDQMLEAIANAVDIIIIEDAQTDERVNKEIVARLKNRTIVNVPIVLFDRHLGSIGMGTFGDEGVLIPTQPQEEFLKALASQMAVSFDRIHLANRRNQVEEALRISEESFRRLVEYSPVSMAVWSGIDGRVILFNKKFTELFGYTIEDIPDVAHWWTVAYPDKAYRESQMQLWAKLNDGTEPLDNHKPTEAIITGKDGTPRNIELRISNSHQDKSLVTLIDRTEQKLAEEKLRNTAQRLNEAQRLAHIGSWELDLVNNVLIWSDEIYRMFEIDPNKFSATYEAFLDAIHPDDREAVNIAYTRSLKTRTTYAIDHRIVYSDGRVKYVHEQCETYYDGDKPTRSIGTVQDITERKQAEEALRESELKYREIFDNVLDSLFLLEVTDDGHFRNLEVNPAFEKSTGIARTQLIGKVIEETVPKNVADIVNAKYHRCVEAGIPIEEEAELDLPTGRRYFHSTLIPARNEIGRIHRIIGISRDITDRKKAEDALRESEAKFFTVFQLSPMALSITSIKDQVFLDVNNSFLQNVGYKRDELIGKSSNILDLWADHGLWDKFRQIMADKGKIDNFEFEFRGKPGKYGYGLISATIVTINGAPCVLSQIANINDRKAMEEKIRTLNRELERRIFERTAQLESANKELEAFAYSVSHDLRAPLRGIDGFCQVLFDEYKGNMDEAGKNYLMRIRAAAQRMGQLIDDMLELSRISRSEMKIHQVDLSNIANEITNELNESAPGRKVNFSIQNGIQVNGDGRLLRIVLENLMGNAWKFTSKHSKASIMFGMQIVDGNPAYFVSDDGAGFDMNYAQKLFGAFQRLHTAKEFEGTGIGLATVQRIVHRHGGKVWAKGEVEKGATFYFTIP